VIPHDDEVDLSLAADEDADLPVGLSGNLAEGPGKLEGENPVNRNFAAVELLDASDLAGLETGNVAIKSIDASTSGITRQSVLSSPCNGVSGIGYRERGINP
jgi:hypothetical protein